MASAIRETQRRVELRLWEPLSEERARVTLAMLVGGSAARDDFAPLFNGALLFQGNGILANGGSGYGRFNATVVQAVKSHTPDEGQLVFALAQDDSVPQLVGLFIPVGVDLTKPVPLHIFFCPSTVGKAPPYPFSTGAGNSFNATLGNFLAGADKRLINQHVAANKNCVLVFPLPPPVGYFQGIQDATRLRRYCLELVFFLQRSIGNVRIPAPELGRCALSGFSEGGRPLHNIVQSALSADGFPELKIPIRPTA